MPDPSRLRALVSRLNGGPPPTGPPRIRRRSARVLLVLLSGADHLYGFTIMRTARIGSGALYPLLIQLAKAGLVERTRLMVTVGGMPTGENRVTYKLTDKGRSEAFRLLGLEAPQ